MPALLTAIIMTGLGLASLPRHFGCHEILLAQKVRLVILLSQEIFYKLNETKISQLSLRSTQIYWPMAKLSPATGVNSVKRFQKRRITLVWLFLVTEIIRIIHHSRNMVTAKVKVMGITSLRN